MWIAAASLVGLGLVSTASSLASLSQTGGGGGTLSLTSSWSDFQTSSTLAMRIMEASSYAQMILFPMAALSSAGYILLLDRDVSRGAMPRGFEVEAGQRGDGT
jgi:hypothetical protein